MASYIISPSVSMRRAPVSLLLAAGSMLLLSAKSEPYAFSFSVGPYEEGKSCPITMRYIKSRFPTAYIAIDVQTPNQSMIAGEVRPISLYPDADGYVTYTYSLPSYLFREGEEVYLLLGLAKESYYRGLDASRFYVWYPSTRKVKSTAGIYFYAQDTVEQLHHEFYVYDPRKDENKVIVEHDTFSVQEVPSGHLYSRNVLVSDCTLTYLAGDYVRSLPSPSGELRILSHKEDYLGFAQDSGAFATVPLKVTATKVVDGEWLYTWSAKDPIIYSRVDLKGYRSDPGEDPTFTSRDIYVPLRQGHDGDAASFQICLHNIGVGRDEVVISYTVYPKSGWFGPCDSSRYCVVRNAA